MRHHEETLSQINFGPAEQHLRERGYRISDLFHMTGYLQFDLIHTAGNRPLSPKTPYSLQGVITVHRKRDLFYATYSKYNVCAKSKSLWGAIKQIAPKAI